jgi:hypothetical protein
MQLLEDLKSNPYIDRNVTEAIANYLVHGWDAGSFTMACLRNDLATAAISAHPSSLKSLGHIGQWLALSAPEGSWGSRQMVEGWQAGNDYRQAFERALTWARLNEGSHYEQD